MLFVNLPVTDLSSSRAFYEALGFTRNPDFSSEDTACMVWSETIFVMLLTHSRWKTFTARPIPPRGSNEVMLGLSCEGRAQVDALLEAAENHGGQHDINPVQDLGFMYNRAFTDPDGHIWEAFWMDTTQAV